MHRVQRGDDRFALRVRALDPAVAALAESARRIRPNEYLLNPLAQFLAERVREGRQQVQSESKEPRICSICFVPGSDRKKTRFCADNRRVRGPISGCPILS